MEVSELLRNFIVDDLKVDEILLDHSGLVLVFLPDTTGISSQLQLKNLRNNSFLIKSLGWYIIVITSQTKEEANNATEELKLPFPVIYDYETHFAAVFNTLGTSFSNPYISKRTKRRTFILQQNYEIAHVIDDIHPGYHTDDILQVIQDSTGFDMEAFKSKA